MHVLLCGGGGVRSVVGGIGAPGLACGWGRCCQERSIWQSEVPVNVLNFQDAICSVVAAAVGGGDIGKRPNFINR